MGFTIKEYDDFILELNSKNIKFLTDLELRKEIIYFFQTVSWKKIYETKRTLLALNLIREKNKGYEVV